MNEIELIRNQIAVEHRHAVEVAAHCAALLNADPPEASPPAELQATGLACGDYLLLALARAAERDAALDALPDSPAPLRRIGAMRPELAMLQTRLAALLDEHRGRSAADPGFLAALGRLAEEAQRLFAQRAAWTELPAGAFAIPAWRRVARVDADSILEERARYAQVQARAASGPTR